MKIEKTYHNVGPINSEVAVPVIGYVCEHWLLFVTFYKG
jgi:hypothetical protein